MKPFEIHSARHPVGKADYPRPWLIVDVRQNGLVGCFFISTECYGLDMDCFCLDENDPDFPATGLHHSCYINWVHIFDVPHSAFINKRGDLQGNLLQRFRKGAGI